MGQGSGRFMLVWIWIKGVRSRSIQKVQTDNGGLKSKGQLTEPFGTAPGHAKLMTLFRLTVLAKLGTNQGCCISAEDEMSNGMEHEAEQKDGRQPEG